MELTAVKEDQTAVRAPLGHCPGCTGSDKNCFLLSTSVVDVLIFSMFLYVYFHCTFLILSSQALVY